ncbi:hypothetical protein OBBRIDRAFT_148787 [Obba rivulosa]|uniref:Uncharacterized protein n=1 Tax=Obba rivulosa TaxID=1052685 RepID=A0A8E2DHW9_9APHY|nr:hypothetical protein OBBRIDRAFT_148787 [Obba rivulosa]
MCSGTGHRRRDGQSFEAWFTAKVGGLLSAPSTVSFSSALSSILDSGATGTIDGRSVNKAGLQSALSALKQKWDASTGKLAKASPIPGTDQNAAVKLVWKLNGKQVGAYFKACCCQDSDGKKIDSLALEGDASLFK